MYEAKRNHLGVVWYQPELDADAPRRLDLYLSVSSALENDDYFVHFQPKVSLIDGRITGAEAVVRWNHPAHGPISPAEFVPLIVQSGLIGKLTRLVVRRAIEAAVVFHAAGLRCRSPSTSRPATCSTLYSSTKSPNNCGKPAIDPSLLTMEITEDAMVVDFDTSGSALRRMRELGIRVAIDDFGTGYSSMQLLHRLPVDELKIDQSFIQLTQHRFQCRGDRARVDQPRPGPRPVDRR